MPASAVVLAAGRGLRFNPRVSKLLSRINSRPVIAYCLEKLQQHPSISEIIVVANPKNRDSITAVIKRFKISKASAVVLGGRRRQDSVRNGLKVSGGRSELILIHDAARPFIDAKIVSALIRKARRLGAAIPAVPARSTIKRVSPKMMVRKTIPRDNLWEVQTPQVFNRELLLKAYKRFGYIDVTDDAMLVERLGVEVGVVSGSYDNIKITTPQDLVLAEAISKSKKILR
ncbi:MAG: 2-C-methyl-D-erythritol 4-phosphate cytidylyltransferase [Candidatus Omnitrophica bacterium]|nr:2-C-methyl-D-erythritol 4-phosphate cytidylyltransferase [Candidatus Omnitrophota bacterium]